MRKHFFTLILALFAGIGAAWAQDYDFSAVCSTGQTLYYKIIDEDARKVKLTCPDNYTIWDEFQKPVGDIVLPEMVANDGITYTVTEIGDYAFEECDGLTGSLNIPNTVISIGECAFELCRGFTGSLNIGNSVTTIGEHAFSACSGFSGSLNIGNSVTIIGDGAFSDCYGFTGSLNIGNSVIEIGNCAFQGCSGFNGMLNIGNSVTTIGVWAFGSCRGFVGSLIIPNSVSSIGSSAFDGCCGFNGSLKIGNSVSSIGELAFSECSGFTTLIMCNSVAEIGYDAFYHCRGIASIISMTSTPPASYSDGLFFGVFIHLNDSIPVYVPCGSSEAYSQAEAWNYFSNFHEFNPYDIALFSSDETMGSVAITQLPDCETGICKVKATPFSGYQFDYWMENGAQVSTEAEYSFEATADRTLTAYFSETLNVNSFAEPEVQLFPNPTNDVLNVVCDGMRHVTIMNTLGQVVYDAEPADDQSAQISLSGFDAGVYIVRITTDNGMISKSVVKAEL